MSTLQPYPYFEKWLKIFEEMQLRDAINFEVMNEILISYHSTAIEGSSLTEEEARLVVLEGIVSNNKALIDYNMLIDHMNAFKYMVEMANQREKITPSLIQSINAHVMKTTGSVINAMSGSYDSSKGDWRKSMVHVGDRYFSNFQKVPQEVAELCKNINDKIDTIKTPVDIYALAFEAHFRLVSVHPFADGNGRTSRLLMNYVLQYHHQPLAMVFNEDKLDYFKALEDSRKNDNIEIFQSFMFTQQVKYFQKEIEKVEPSKK